LLREGVRLVVWEGESKAVRWCLLFGPGGPCGGAVWRRSSAVASAMAPLEAATHTPKAQESKIYIYVQSMTFVIRALEKPSQFCFFFVFPVSIENINYCLAHLACLHSSCFRTRSCCCYNLSFSVCLPSSSSSSPSSMKSLSSFSSVATRYNLISLLPPSLPPSLLYFPHSFVAKLPTSPSKQAFAEAFEPTLEMNTGTRPRWST